MVENRTRRAAASTLILLFLLAACQSETTPEPEAYSAPTAAVTLERIAGASKLQEPTATPPCSYGAEFLEDLTIPDGSSAIQGQTLDKRWAVQNTGSCDWGPEFRLVRVDPGAEAGAIETALYPARAGETAVWRITMTAPQKTGDFLASWQARSPEGFLFGDQVFILIHVEGPGESTG